MNDTIIKNQPSMGAIRMAQQPSEEDIKAFDRDIEAVRRARDESGHITIPIRHDIASAIDPVRPSSDSSSRLANADSPPNRIILRRGIFLADELARANRQRSQIPFDTTHNSPDPTQRTDSYLFHIRERICACGRSMPLSSHEIKLNTTLISQIASHQRSFLRDINVGLKRKLYAYGPCQCYVRDPSVKKGQISSMAPRMNTRKTYRMYACGHVRQHDQVRVAELREKQRPEAAEQSVMEDMVCVYFDEPCGRTGCVSRFEEGVEWEEVFERSFLEACRETVGGSGWMEDF